MIYLGLKCTIIMFYLPLTGIAVQLFHKDGYIHQPDNLLWERVIAINTELPAVRLFLISCFVGAVINCVRHIRKRQNLDEILAGVVSEDDPMRLAEFERIKNKLKLKCKVEAVRCDMIFSPMAVGIIHKKVLLPYLRYEKHEITAIYYHELAHFKKRDLVIKILTVLLEIVQSLNPFVYLVSMLADNWCEINCDNVGISYLEKENVSRKEYYQTLFDIFDEDKLKERDMFDSHMLFKSKSGLERRIDYMLKYTLNNNKKQFPKWTAYTVVFSLMIISTISAYAATVKLAEWNDELYKATQKEVVVAESEASEVQVTELDPDWMDSAVFMKPGTVQTRGRDSFDWKIDPGTKALTSKIYLPEGTGIYISCIAKPNTCPYKYGIQWGSTEMSSYCIGGNTSNTFTSDAGRYYYLFVENNGGSTLSVNVTYSY